MKFYKVVLAAFIGTLIALVINFFIKVGVVSSMISNLSKSESETSTTVKPNSVLYMKLDYEIPDRTTDNPFSNINFQTMETSDATGLNEILRNIENAKTDANIKGIYLELSSIPTSMATIQEIRNKLIEFKESGTWPRKSCSTSTFWRNSTSKCRLCAAPTTASRAPLSLTSSTR